jgi:hypothetical protein
LLLADFFPAEENEGKVTQQRIKAKLSACLGSIISFLLTIVPSRDL